MQSTTAIPQPALEEKIKNRTARVGIIGLGYVGLPLAMEFAKAGFSVTGIDIQAIQGLAVESRRVLRPGCSHGYVKEVGMRTENFALLQTFQSFPTLDTINIAVPTPLRKTKDPDMSYIVSACQETAKYLGPGKLVILESTTYPGTTDELVLPMLEAPGWKVGEDFFLCFSPERVDPGNPQYQTANIPKGSGRHYARLHPARARCSMRKPSKRWCRSAPPAWRRW